MTRIVNLKIKNFRGIKSLDQNFDAQFICLIGRGDSCKTTILEAISSVLSPNYRISFYDPDFYNSNTDENIEIEVTLIDFPQEFQLENKYGRYKKKYDASTKKIIADITIDNDDMKDSITIKLTIDKHLEPQWTIIGRLAQEPINISAHDRAKLNCFLVADYTDRHFSWNKGNPLYSLLNSIDGDASENKNIIVDILRIAKNKIDAEDFGKTKEAIQIVEENARALGLNISDAKTAIDFRDIAINDGKIYLNDKDNIPFRLKGKGTKRIASMAIQLSLAKKCGGIILIDEVEQGLEPDRIKQVVRSLAKDNQTQIFITTHSRDAVEELTTENLFLTKRNDDNGTVAVVGLPNKPDLQGTIRACPEAFFAKKIIICEGATEIGICRALDKYRTTKGNPNMVSLDCTYIDGNGENLFIRVDECKAFFNKLCVFMDSDTNGKLLKNKTGQELGTQKEKKNIWIEQDGIAVFDCADNNNIEKQVIMDLPWNAVQKLIQYVIKIKYQTESQLINEIKKKYPDLQNITTICSETADLRNALAEIASGKKGQDGKKHDSWFKRIDHGEFLGEVIFSCFDALSGTHLKDKMLEPLLKWIDE
ncbi:MAG: AAA family ATPase [Bacteroidales bacterium]|jgi:predicted ATP-dependent endonuclease of OLD family|nr:AAA family ATPase [Bacteroidales bacterium]